MTSQSYSTSSLKVGNNGLVYTFIDSGVPAAAGDSYTTIFALHGLAFNAGIFKKVVALASKNNIRMVAVNRRGYRGTSWLPQLETEASRDALAVASDDVKAAFLRTMGVDLALFIDQFIQTYNLPPVSPAGDSGGVALLSWSMGAIDLLAALAHIDELPADAQARFRSHIRRVILQEPPYLAIGEPPRTPKTWNPMMEESVPVEQRKQNLAVWLTSYFSHGDLSTHDLDVLAYVDAGTDRTPSIMNMTPEDLGEIIDSDVDELGLLHTTYVPARANYEKVCFDAATKQKLPHLKIHAFCSSRTTSFTVYTFWLLQEHDEQRGGGYIDCRLLEGPNHFMLWDEPELTMQVYLDALA